MKKPSDFLKTIRAKKAQLTRLLKENAETSEAPKLMYRIELLNIVSWEFGNKMHNNSLKNLGHRNKF
jgi:hypothetical protein